ncbi:hypothetical protein BGZ73_003176 [Actinomortierella ambigua]|nr:hypothetical protein BGZ73_003176 [Actinomortierella ambigua]
MSLPRLLKRPSSAIFPSRARHPHDPPPSLFLTSPSSPLSPCLPSPITSTAPAWAARHVRWASIVPYTIHNPNPPPPPLSAEQALAQFQQQPQHGAPLNPFFGPLPSQQPQQSPQQQTLTYEQQLEHQQRLRQQEELQLQLQNHRNALQQQQLKRQIEQEQEQDQERVRGAHNEMRRAAALPMSEEAATPSLQKEKMEGKLHSDQELREQADHKPTSQNNSTTAAMEEQQQEQVLPRQRRSTFGYYVQSHYSRQQQGQLQQDQARPVRDLVQEATTRTLSISTMLPKRVSKISFEDRVQLAMLDYTGSQIDAMSPEHAADILFRAKNSKESSPMPKTQEAPHHCLSATETAIRIPHTSTTDSHTNESSLRGIGERVRLDHSRDITRKEHQPTLSSGDSDNCQYEIHAPLCEQRSPVESNHHQMSSSSPSVSPKPAGVKSSAVSLHPSTPSSSSF